MKIKIEFPINHTHKNTMLYVSIGPLDLFHGIFILIQVIRRSIFSDERPTINQPDGYTTIIKLLPLTELLSEIFQNCCYRCVLFPLSLSLVSTAFHSNYKVGENVSSVSTIKQMDKKNKIKFASNENQYKKNIHSNEIHAPRTFTRITNDKFKFITIVLSSILITSITQRPCNKLSLKRITFSFSCIHMLYIKQNIPICI